MLWLAGLMGLMAVGAATYVDITGPKDDDDTANGSGPADAAEDPQADGLAPPDLLTVAESTAPGGVLAGTGADEFLTGTEGDDQIGGYDGADALRGGPGADDLHGHEGADTLWGEEGDDSLQGGSSDDDLHGGAGDDSLAGQGGDDFLFGGDGADHLNGSEGDDVLAGEAGADALLGGLGDDALAGGAGEDNLIGGWGDDTLSGVEDTPERDFLNGGGGDDVIRAGALDVVTAGEGADLILIDEAEAGRGAVEILDYRAGQDSLLFVWDDALADSTPPDLTVETDPEGPATLVLLGDMIVARVTGDAVGIADIALIPASAAAQLGIEAA